MAAPNRYTSFVKLARIVLPLLALGLLSTLFLLSRKVDPDAAIPFADADATQIAKEQRLAEPRFATVLSDGSAVRLEAQSARPNPDDPRAINALDVRANVETPRGISYKLTADEALLDGRGDRLDLVGSVFIETSDGFRISTQKLTGSLTQTEFSAPGPVSATGPGLALDAGRMDLVPSQETQHLIFKNGVKLVYQPE